MKIKTKLLISICFVPILIAILIIVGLYQLNSLKQANFAVQRNYDASVLVEDIHRQFQDASIHLRNIVMTEDPAIQQGERGLLMLEGAGIREHLAALGVLMTDEEIGPLVERLNQANLHFIEYVDEVLHHVLSGNREAAISLIESRSREFHEEFFLTIQAIHDMFRENTTGSMNAVQIQFQRSLTTGYVSILACVLLAIGSVSFMTWRIVDRINRVSTVMSDVAHGVSDLTTRLEPEGNDEIDAAARSFNLMAQSLMEQTEREKNDNWVKTRIAGLTTELTGSKSLEDLCRTFLSKAAPLLDACHAVFYVREQEEAEREPVLRLKASYAFKERKHLKNEFLLGESLIGQAALERSPIILTNVPPDYVTVRSGLGEAAPQMIYVCPVIFQDEVLAVVEFATFRELGGHQRAFLEEMTASLGIILDNEMGRIRLARLLEESQQLTEELQAQSEELKTQQEELKAINEELEMQTQALRRSEERLQQQQEELEQSNEELKEKAETLERINAELTHARRELEEQARELEEQARQLALSSRYKSEFLANMSHELRTPLNSMLILSKLLASNNEGNLTAKQVEFARTIHQSGSDLLALINDILDLAKIESGNMDVEPGQVMMAELAEYLEKAFRPLASEKRLQFELAIHERAPESIVTDELRVKQVLKNLLSNAFKFTHEGKVTLDIDAGELEGGRRAVAFRVTDTGIGIAKDHLEQIFEAFKQADGTTSRKYGGTGLGLSISREIAERLGGRLAVESEEGKGSTFTFVVGDYDSAAHGEAHDVARDAAQGAVHGPAHGFASGDGGPEAAGPEAAGPSAAGPPGPGHAATDAGSPVRAMREIAAAASAPVTAPASAASSSSSAPAARSASEDRIKKILIVDDDVHQQSSLMELIGGLDVVISAVSSGAEAMELLKVDHYDIMVLDLGLGDTTGFELLEDLRAKGMLDRLRVFVYTGRELGSREEMQLKKYAHTIIIKDEHAPERLLEELEAHLASGQAARATAADPEASGSPAARQAAARPSAAHLSAAHPPAPDPSAALSSAADPAAAHLTAADRSVADWSAANRPDADWPIGDPLAQDRPVGDFATADLNPAVPAEPGTFPSAARRPEVDAPELAGKHVLLIDDDVRNVFAISNILEMYGMHVIYAENGMEGLDILQSMEDELHLVLMDIMMPVMDGYDTIRAIRGNPRYADLPIIALTAKAMKEDREKCLEAGASDYIAKPVDPDQLISLIQVWLYPDQDRRK